MSRNFGMILWDRLNLALASGLGIGYLPSMPGTLGSLEGIALGFILKDFPVGTKIGLLMLITLLGIVVSQRAIKLLGNKDPDKVVIDEVVGAYQSCLLAKELWEFILAFVLFRVIDILKPWPVRQAERLRGGYGVMMDDLVAGLLTLGLLLFIISLKNALW